ncbi:hypothetical protein ACQ3I4_11180 [Zafaria sp. Z1313]|uniref:hypothetical protein n=1 Tax=Zafaria sp. Z1313 TaxID=3423202 RepID=UPI003D301A5F
MPHHTPHLPVGTRVTHRHTSEPGTVTATGTDTLGLYASVEWDNPDARELPRTVHAVHLVWTDDAAAAAALDKFSEADIRAALARRDVKAPRSGHPNWCVRPAECREYRSGSRTHAAKGATLRTKVTTGDAWQDGDNTFTAQVEAMEAESDEIYSRYLLFGVESDLSGMDGVQFTLSPSGTRVLARWLLEQAALAELLEAGE